MYCSVINSSSPGQKGCHFVDIFESIFINEKSSISIQISLKFVSKGSIDLFHNNFSPSGTQPEHHKLAHEL